MRQEDIDSIKISLSRIANSLERLETFIQLSNKKL